MLIDFAHAKKAFYSTVLRNYENSSVYLIMDMVSARRAPPTYPLLLLLLLPMMTPRM